jgi:hypothetical protein
VSFRFHFPVIPAAHYYAGLHETVIYAEAGAELKLFSTEQAAITATISGVLRDAIP